MLNVKDPQQRLRNVTDIRVAQNGKLRNVDTIYAKVGNSLRIVWQRVRKSMGWVFTQGHPISVSGKFIRLNGQK